MFTGFKLTRFFFLVKFICVILCFENYSLLINLWYFDENRYYKYVEGDHILFIINRERAGVQFDLIYDSIFQRCRKHVFRKKPPTMPNEINH